MSSILQGDALAVLKTLKSESVHMMITSPPYYGLRNYKTNALVWGGSSDCQHEWIGSSWRNPNSSGGWQGGSQLGIGGSEGQKVSDYHTREIKSQNCSKCGAWLGSLGNEPNPDLYVSNLVQIFKEVKRVLRPEGTVWLNMGDTFSANRSYQVADSKWKNVENNMSMSVPLGLKPKDLMGIPWKLAFALQADGWWLRSDIIWAKGCSFGPYVGNPMPESVSGSSWQRHRIKVVKSERAKPESYHSLSQEGINPPQGARDGADFKDHGNEYVDCPGCEKCSPNDGYILKWNAGRPTRAHEYIFLLSKSEKYFFDQEAVKEKSARSFSGNKGRKEANVRGMPEDHSHVASSFEWQGSTRNIRSVWTIPNELENLFWEWYDSQKEQFSDVWTITTKGYREAHFATFPISLITPIIKAGSSEKGCCSNCGMPWVRIIDHKSLSRNELPKDHIHYRPSRYDDGKAGDPQSPGAGQRISETKTLGWKPTCQCNAGDPVPCTILDIFGGAGTSGVVAIELGRKFILIELNSDYIEMAKKRIAEAAMKKLEEENDSK